VTSVDRRQIEDRVRQVLAEELTREPEEITPEARFEEDLDADSLDLVQAVMALEEALDVKIPEEEMDGVKTVGQAVDLVASKLGVSA
jgi:acyl carrier protein